MSMDVSRLAVSVESTGIKETSDALGGLSRSAGTADKRVESLTDKLSKLLGVMPGTTSNANALSGVMGMIASALQSASASAQATAAALGQVTQGMGNLTQATTSANQALQGTASHGHVVTNTLKAMATAALAYMSVGTARNIVEQADAWGMMQAKLRIATGSMQEAKEEQQKLFDMAQKLRAPLDDMSKLYTRLAPALGRMGKSSEEVRNMVEGVTLALKLQGATSAEAASTMLQFSQSANAGRLNGAEFNSVAENGVLILRALEDHLGKNQSELKKMGAEGKLTFDIISAALEKQLPKWREQFNTLPVTFESAMQRIKNAWFKAVGETGQETELGRKLTDALLKLEEDIPRIAETVVGALTFMIDNGKALTAVLAGVFALGAVKWALEGAAAFSTITASITAAGGAAVVLRAALAFLGGPIGIIAGLLAAGATAWALWGDSGEKSSKKLTDQTTIDVDARIRELNREIAKLQERNREMAGGKEVEEGGKKLSAAAQQQLDTLVELRKKQMDPAVSDATKAALQISIDQNQAKFEQLLLLEQGFAAEQKITEEKRKQKVLAELGKAATKKFGTPSERAQQEVDDWKEKYKAQGADLPADIEKAIREKYTHADKKAETEAERQQKAALQAALNVRKLGEETAFATAKIMEHESSTEKLTGAERELFELDKLMQKTTDAKALAVLNAAKADLERVRAQELVKEGLQNEYKLREDAVKSQGDQRLAAEKELHDLNDKIAAYGLAKGVVEEYGLANAKAKLDAMTLLDDGSDVNGEIKRQRDLIAVLEEVQRKKKDLGQLELGTTIKKELEALKPADFGNDMAAAFGKIGKSFDMVGKSLDTFSKRMVKINELRKTAAKLEDPTARANAMKEANDAELRSTLNMYGDMAGAAKGFFSEKTVAYKAFDALEKGMRIAQIALTWQEMAAKVTATETAMTLKAAATTESVALDGVETTSAIGAAMAQATAWTTAGVAHAFAQLGVFGFVGAAAIIAFMASMGAKTSGTGSGPNIAEERQKANGTGTVLGDDTAKSESISKSLDAMRDNSNIGLTYTSEMLVSLRNIDSKMGGLTSTIARISGMTTGKNFDTTGLGTNTSGGLFGIGGLFGKTVTKEIQDTGLRIQGALSNLQTSQYLDVQTTTKKSGFFGIGGSTKTTSDRTYQGVNGQLQNYIGDIFKDINTTIVKAGTSLGLSGDEMQKRLNEFVLNAEISLKDLKGDDLKAALESFFSASADQLAQYAAGSFSLFQKAGEGYFETLVRVASGVERAKDAMSRLGVEMILLQDVTNKTGDVDVELVRQSLMRQEAGTSLAHIMEILDGSMEDLIANYRDLTRIRNTMQSMGMAANSLSLDLIRGAGGIKELSTAFDSYVSNFYTDEEQTAMKMSQLNVEFNRLGVAMPTSRNAFKALVQTLMASGAQGQELAGRILSLSDSFSDAMKMFDDTTGKRITDARDALRESYDRESEALENTRDKMKGFADSMKEFKDSLVMNDLSPLSTMEKYQTALARYEDVSTRAMGGDEDAIGKFQSVANELLSLSRQVNASGSDYMADFNRVLAATSLLEQYTQGQADQATTQLEAMKQQVEALISIEESTKTVAQAIVELLAVMGGNTSTLTGQVSASVVNTADSGVPSAPLTAAPSVQPATSAQAATAQQTTASMVAELAALRAELSALRTDQAAQAARQVGATYEANDLAADKVVDGLKPDPTTSSSWQQPVPIA